jgi:hypothetical protein
VSDHVQPAAIAGHGTLNVVLATPQCIVVATDSRRTAGGQYTDIAKKLLRVGATRVLAIAGLLDVTIQGFPSLTAQVVPLVESQIHRGTLDAHDDLLWNDPPPPAGIPEEFKSHWHTDPSIWWPMITGPLQTVYNIAATYGPTDLTDGRLVGLLAGFKTSGEAKITRLMMEPRQGISSWGRPYIGVARGHASLTTAGSLISQTAGRTDLADLVLHGDVAQARNRAGEHRAIAAFLARREAGTVDAISEVEMVDLAQALIEATAAVETTVGGPIQLARMTPGTLVLEQPDFPDPGHFLPADGTWHLGVIFTSDYPFGERVTNVVYTFCEIRDASTAIPLGGNHFYGNTLERSTFVYQGGSISFGNNTVLECTLVIAAGVDEAPLAPIQARFSHIVRST